LSSATKSRKGESLFEEDKKCTTSQSYEMHRESLNIENQGKLRKKKRLQSQSERSIEQMWRTKVRMQFQLPGDGIGTRTEALFRNQAADKMTRL
jgi:hypothetical protein